MTHEVLELGSECRQGIELRQWRRAYCSRFRSRRASVIRSAGRRSALVDRTLKKGDDPEVLAGSSLTIGLSRVEVGMWERISAVDIEDAKAQLSRKRGETLSRQAEEIKSVDTQLHDIESFERVVAAFFEEYMNSKVPSVPAVSVPEQSVSLPESGKPSAQAPQNAPSLVLQIRQNILPNLRFYRALGD